MSKTFCQSMKQKHTYSLTSSNLFGAILINPIVPLVPQNFPESELVFFCFTFRPFLSICATIFPACENKIIKKKQLINGTSKYFQSIMHIKKSVVMWTDDKSENLNVVVLSILILHYNMYYFAL